MCFELSLNLRRCVDTHVRPSPNVIRVAAMFGLGIDDSRSIKIVPETNLQLRPGMLVYITGASGSGKSTILSLIQQACQSPEHDAVRVVQVDQLPPLADVPLIDALPHGDDAHDIADDDDRLQTTLKFLSVAGLGDAFVMLRTPGELSDGQRYRLRLAQAMTSAAGPMTVILADEFAATLDRVTAQVIARNVRKWVTDSPACFICATTHDDLLEPLDPDVLIVKHLGSGIDIACRDTNASTSEPAATTEPCDAK